MKIKPPLCNAFAALLFWIASVHPGMSFAQSMVMPPVPPPAVLPAPGSHITARQTHVVKHKGDAEPAQQQSVYSHGNPTNEEQYELELVNRARANPVAEGNILSTTTDQTISFKYTYFGSPSRAKVKSDFLTYTVKPPLAFNGSLITAARSHDVDMFNHNYQGHQGTDGSWPQDRARTAGYSGSYVGENVAAYSVSTWDAEASFLIDFGNDSTLGHRKNILDIGLPGLYTEIGIGIVDSGTGFNNNDVGPMIVTDDFGDRGQTFVLGVVYNDANHNGFYDQGEGLSGVTIKPSSGSYSAVTSASGGYAFPVSGSQSFTITASGGGLQSPISKTVDFTGENLKVDFTTAMTGIPGVTTLILPLADTTINRDTALFQWNRMSGATL
jgi:hypothetical protein